MTCVIHTHLTLTLAMRVLTRSFRVARVQPFNRMHFQPIIRSWSHEAR